MKYDYHLIVLGAGSAGLTVAAGAATMGAKVALIEKEKMGGDCLNYGCVPSKTFLRSAHLARDIRHADEFGISAQPGKTELKSVMQRVAGVIAEIEPHDSRERFEALGVDVFLDSAHIADPHTVTMSGKTITAKNLIIATGSEPLIPDIPGLDGVDFFTNKTIFGAEQLPRRLLVMGGGPVGAELGQGFRHLGARVSIIDKADSLFRKDEPEVWPLMREVFEADGIDLELLTSVVGARRQGEQIILTVERGGDQDELSGDMLLLATGRNPNSRGFGLEELGIEMDNRGFIKTNNRMQTNIKSIYAAGDVTGPYLFTHMAGYQGAKIIPNVILNLPQKASYAQVPWTTYTKPEVAHIGDTEAQAKSAGRFGKQLFLDLDDNDRAKAESDKRGFLKLVLDKKSRVIGATLVSNKAGEIIPLASMAIAQKSKISAFSSFIYSYPTAAEIFQRAAREHMKQSFKPWIKKLIHKLFL